MGKTGTNHWYGEETGVDTASSGRGVFAASDAAVASAALAVEAAGLRSSRGTIKSDSTFF